MKKSFLFIILIACFGCNKVSDDIQATWIVTEQSFIDCDNSSENGNVQNISTTPCSENSSVGCTYESFYFFSGTYTGEKITKTGVGILSFSQFDGTYLSSESSLKICEANNCIDYDLVLSANELELTSQTQNSNGCIVKFLMTKS